MIGRYMNQAATWKRKTGNSGYGGDAIFADPVEIKVRWEGRRRLVRDKQGQEVVSEALVFCAEPVQPGDVLVWQEREWPVIAVSESVGLDGRAQFLEVSL